MAMSIDGPYGNRDTANKLAYYDKALLIAGGSGTGYSLPLLESILGDPTSTAEVHVTIAVRNSTSAHWVVDKFERVLGSHTSNRKVHIDIHITDDAAPTISGIASDEESGKTALENTAPVVSGNGNVAVVYGKGRPDLKELVRRHTMDVDAGTKVAVTSCGPASMGFDVRNSCADAQGRILRGKGRAGEVWLHCEAFGS
jgi:NAD(P)H-flavin reductase